jgi:hypothetical protein
MKQQEMCCFWLAAFKYLVNVLSKFRTDRIHLSDIVQWSGINTCSKQVQC